MSPQEVYDEFGALQTRALNWRTMDAAVDSIEFATERGRVLGLAEALVRYMPDAKAARLLGLWTARQEVWPKPCAAFSQDGAHYSLDSHLWRLAMEARIETYQTPSDSV